MPFALWTSALSTGVTSMDEEHRGLFMLVNELHEARTADISRADTARVISRLKEYATIHFMHEEALMDRMQFPDSEDHREMHRTFVQKVLDIEDRHAQGERALPAEILDFLKDWLVSHIAEQDMRYVGWLQKHNP